MTPMRDTPPDDRGPGGRAPRRLRAYALVQGRTHVDAELSMDDMLTAGAAGGPARSPEQQRIAALCATAPQTLADLSAELDLPVQVVRVLLAELIADGVIAANGTADRVLPPHHDLALLEEVLDGIESL